MKVFVTYSRPDEGAVRSLAGDLQRARMQVWFDEQLVGGDAWWTAILEQIRESTVFLFALSNNSLYSKPCRAERNYAQALGLPILPVQVGEISSFRADPIFSRQLIDYRKPTSATGFALMGALNERAAERADLPDPLPDAPPIPYEYLQRLGALVHDPAILTAPVQAEMLFELRNALHDEDDPTVLDDIRNLLRALRRRTDVTYAIGSEIDTILEFRELQEKQEHLQDEIRALQFLVAHFLTDDERTHLRKIADREPFQVKEDEPNSFFDEMRRLRSLGFLTQHTGRGITTMRMERGDVRDYFDLSETARQYLDLLDKTQQWTKAKASH
jgi:hypothetical protein